MNANKSIILNFTEKFMNYLTGSHIYLKIYASLAATKDHFERKIDN